MEQMIAGNSRTHDEFAAAAPVVERRTA